MLEWILNSKHYSTKVIVSVVIVAFGVGICTVTDVEINVKGFLCACVAVFCTSLQQIVSMPNDILFSAYYFVIILLHLLWFNYWDSKGNLVEYLNPWLILCFFFD